VLCLRDIRGVFDVVMLVGWEDCCIVCFCIGCYVDILGYGAMFCELDPSCLVKFYGGVGKDWLGIYFFDVLVSILFELYGGDGNDELKDFLGAVVNCKLFGDVGDDKFYGYVGDDYFDGGDG